MKYFAILLVFGLLLNSSCKSFNSKSSPVIIKSDSIYGSLIADTIIYDVIIKNPNPDDTWTNECLKNLQHTNLLDSIFNMVYAGQVIAYDFFSQEPLTTRDLKRIEKEENFKRSNIGKIQFTEKWYFDSSTNQLQKEVLSIVLGYELVNDEEMVYGYKPVFRLQLNY